MAFNIAEFFISFFLKGQQEVQAGVQSVTASVEDLGKKVTSSGVDMDKQLQGTADATKKLGEEFGKTAQAAKDGFGDVGKAAEEAGKGKVGDPFAAIMAGAAKVREAINAINSSLNATGLGSGNSLEDLREAAKAVAAQIAGIKTAVADLGNVQPGHGMFDAIQAGMAKAMEEVDELGKALAALGARDAKPLTVPVPTPTTPPPTPPTPPTSAPPGPTPTPPSDVIEVPAHIRLEAEAAQKLQKEIEDTISPIPTKLELDKAEGERLAKEAQEEIDTTKNRPTIVTTVLEPEKQVAPGFGDQIAKGMATFGEAAAAAGRKMADTFALIRPALTQTGEAANLVGGQLRNEFNAAAEVLAKTVSSQLTPAVEMGVQAMTEMIAAAQGVSMEDARAQVAVKALADDMGQMSSEVGSLAAQVGGKLGAELQAGLTVASNAFKGTLTPAVEAAKNRVIEMIMQLKGLTRAQAEAQVAAQGLADKARGAGGSAAGVGQSAQQAGLQISGFTIASLTAGISLAGFVRAGLGASAQGEILNLQFSRLSATIAGLFRPEIEAVTNGIRGLVNWFNSMGNAQRTQIATWTMVGASTLAFAAVMPSVVAGINGVILSVRALSASITSGLMTTGFGALIPIIGGMVALMGGLAVGTQAGRSALGALGSALKPVITIFSKFFEVVGPIFDMIGAKIKAMVDKMGPGIQKINDLVVKMMDGFGDMVERLGPAFEIMADKLGDTLIKQLEILVSWLEKASDMYDKMYPKSKAQKDLEIWKERMKAMGLDPQGMPLKKKDEGGDRSSLGLKPVGAMAPEQVYEDIMRKTISLGVPTKDDEKINYLERMYLLMKDIRDKPAPINPLRP